MTFTAVVARSLAVAWLLVAARAGDSSICLYDGRLYSQGAVVASRDVCLHCTCSHGALVCRRRSCDPLPDPLPQGCRIVHQKENCCADLHCPDGVKTLETKEVSRSKHDLSDVSTLGSLSHVCVEGGTVYAAGSAITSNTSCEQCFCLGAARRCIRPQCLPPPRGCRPHPAPGACCPQRYYCDHGPKPPDRGQLDCAVNGNWVVEGERVLLAEASANCTQCFCLRGAVRCQHLACAPPLLGCEPLLRAGECCAHQYHCQHKEPFPNKLKLISGNKLEYINKKYRSINSPKTHEHRPTTKDVVSNSSSLTSSVSDGHIVATTKVKRKTDDPPPRSSSKLLNVTTTEDPNTTTLLSDETTTITTTEKTTEQPEGSVKIMINGTINCTTEISSETVAVNKTQNETDMIKMDVQPRIPIINTEDLNDHTFSPNDIITDRNVNGFDENETFTINVTSSLNTNISFSTKPPKIASSKIASAIDLAEASNASKKTKGDYDYDYSEPTLPPSLPNLKIIPFVAADAVVDEESQKETLTYPLLEREDKFPVYFPNVDSKKTSYANRREDVYNSTQYPVFISNKESQYPSLTNEGNVHMSEYPRNDDLVYTLSTSLGNRIPETNIVTKAPALTSTFEVETPAVNLFSPPMETEGGFVPKAPELIDDYYVPYQSTSPTASIPHLTTSMQLDIAKGECVSGDGRIVSEGESITYACYECTCAWAKLHCSPRSCHTPVGCTRRPASSNAADLCCGELICDEDNKTTLSPITTTENKKNDTKIKTEDISLTIKVDVPPKHNQTNFNNTEMENNVQMDSVNSVLHSADNLLKDKINVTKENFTSTNKSQAEKFNTIAAIQNNNHTLNISQEYEDEEDEGFSFGSVLKLLLSKNYETTTSAIPRASIKAVTKPTYKVTTRRPMKQTINPFIPLPHRLYIPPNQQTSVSRIDHLVLGEATPINTIESAATLSSAVTARTSTRPLEITKKEELSGQYTSVTHEGARPSNLGGLGAGMLKLAGCNIYGRMYRVGRIILELSSPCQECWCTELGVQCKPLKC